MRADERRALSLPPRAKNLRGSVFGELTAIGPGEKDKHGNARWVCTCTCGQITQVRAAYLLSGHTQSCGCLRKTAVARLWAKAAEKTKPKPKP